MEFETINKLNEETGSIYDADYFQRGIQSGKSCYQDFRWLPEMTLKFAHKIVRELNLREGDKVLDFGCAMGFMVKAMRILDIEAFGCDVSKYALGNAPKDVADFCKFMKGGKIPFENKFDWIISKDVFEHISEEEIHVVIEDCLTKANKMFVVVPLGDGEKFEVPAYGLDITHKLAKTREWWEKAFEDAGWDVDRFSYLIKGMKDSWAHFPKGNGFFFLSRKE